MAKIRKKDIVPPHPSASILLISPQNRILLLQRVNTSTSFASAHVFPGGHVDPQDGTLPPPSDPALHEDSPAYRLAAIRECFEESGILLAHHSANEDTLLSLREAEREEGRQSVHSQEILFPEWLHQHDAIADIDGLIPFTRWLTPALLKKRYSTQMYLYFLPLDIASASGSAEQGGSQQIPTPDGDVEHTSARYLHAREWLDLALKQEVDLFPPQFVLLSLIAPFLSPPQPGTNVLDHQELLDQRQRLKHWVETDGVPSWGGKCISPDAIKRVKGRYMIMGLADPGPELEGTGRKGDLERVIRVEIAEQAGEGRQRHRPVELCWRREVLEEEKDKVRARI